ncbi:MAG: RecQ family ATP-dependent DNA helicase [Burkholderiaceae bacterium]|nr:RecQ family ATP-dependent DNA helicase [Burkholderiaceae bacterium]
MARERFGVETLRDAQAAVIASVLAGRHTLAVMPTGAGKSLTYQVPALLLPGVTLVISPLIALMQDQAGKLDDAGVSNATLNSTLSRGDEREALQGIDEARHEIVFATPERLADPEFLARMKAQRIDRLVVDEAHCISHWGHDFRPAFLEIGRARRELGAPPVLALTATATEAVIEDIRQQLGLDHLDVINSGVHRPNLHLAVRQVTSEADRSEAIVDTVRATPGAGIVYCATVRACNALADQLARVGERDGFAVTRYHGRLPARERRAQQDAFMAGQARIMVATSAFGMGIDKTDLRFVVHYQMPGTLEAYAQEAGRAGRDGGGAQRTLLFWRKDRNVQQFFIAGRYPNHDELARVYGALPPHDAAAASIDGLSADTQVARNKLQVGLKLLRDAGLATQTRTRTWRLTRQGAAADRLALLATAYRERAEHDRLGLEKMVGYAHSGACRWKLIAEHFGDDSFAAEGARCHHCDNCARLSAPIVIEPVPEVAAVAPAARALFAAGDAVTVPRYGDGVVREASAEQVTVAFGEELRTFVNEVVQRREAVAAVAAVERA